MKEYLLVWKDYYVFKIIQQVINSIHILTNVSLISWCVCVCVCVSVCMCVCERETEVSLNIFTSECSQWLFSREVL